MLGTIQYNMMKEDGTNIALSFRKLFIYGHTVRYISMLSMLISVLQCGTQTGDTLLNSDSMLVLVLMYQI